MNVSLANYTPDLERHIAFCARVSNPKNQNNKEFIGLIRYCIKNKHWSIFEHAFVTMEIKTSRIISRQLLRHRSFTFQEFSQRYAIVEYDYQVFRARSQDLQNRQNSIDNCPAVVNEEFLKLQQSVFDTCYNAYNKAIDMGIAKEQARCLLPESTMTTLYMTGNIRSWIHFVQLRSGNGTQKETQLIAIKCHEILQTIAPNIFINI